MNQLSYSAAGLALTKSFEGLRLEAYRDVGGVLTIGYGHTGPDVTDGETITEECAEMLLRADIAPCVAFVNRVVTVPLTQGQFDALVDFAYNEGREHLLNSTLLKMVNASRFDAAAAEFGIWVYAAGLPQMGLVRRRDAEQVMFAGEAFQA